MNVFPVTDSTVSAVALNKFIEEKYPIGSNFSCALFRTGINDTYFLSNESTKHVARVYSYNWRTESAILEELDLLLQLKADGFPVSYPISDKNGSFIHVLNAPEGTRYMVLFSYAGGSKVRLLSTEMCAAIGTFMAKMHKSTSKLELKREKYTIDVLLKHPYESAKRHFSESLPEMVYLKTLVEQLNTSFVTLDSPHWPQGTVHMDIWYDNFNVDAKGKITVFDFDFCGTGWLLLDVAYFCSQLFHKETDKEQYEEKRAAFLTAYQNLMPLTQQELAGMGSAGAASWVFYVGVQSRRFDWSNIFLTENYLKMFTGRIKSWLEYTK